MGTLGLVVGLLEGRMLLLAARPAKVVACVADAYDPQRPVGRACSLVGPSPVRLSSLLTRARSP